MKHKIIITHLLLASLTALIYCFVKLNYPSPNVFKSKWEVRITYTTGETETVAVLRETDTQPVVTKNGCMWDGLSHSWICGIRKIDAMRWDEETSPDKTQ
jgi:hypothetical protein